MKKLILKFYDKLIVALLFSAFFLASCEPEEPQPEYGVVPMYGVPTNTVSTEKAPDNNINAQK
ncbi:MAG: hypothetical protein QM800_03395 [Paludibacter sp.]